jgi:hypothetical protein
MLNENHNAEFRGRVAVQRDRAMPDFSAVTAGGWRW